MLRTTITLPNSDGMSRLVRYLDPVYDMLDRTRARFIQVLPDGMLELADNDGRVLPDLRHASQVIPY